VTTNRTSTNMTRRRAVQAGVAAAALVATEGVDETAAAAEKAPEWLTLLGRSEQGGRDYAPRIEGKIPAGLEGSLYRNGPGLFERGGVRKPHLLDGDGLVQRLTFQDGAVRYQNSFVRTRKIAQEEVAGRYLYPTWSLRAPGGLFANLGGGAFKSQAGVTVYPFDAKLYAFDEVSPAYTLDPERLTTLGEAPLGRPGVTFAIKAHTKRDSLTGQWLLAGITHGRSMQLHAIVHAADGTLEAHHIIDSPRQVYIHDFFATERHLHLPSASDVVLAMALPSRARQLHGKPQLARRGRQSRPGRAARRRRAALVRGIGRVHVARTQRLRPG
jgi:all-trans-8'-apo-beta-carotenal 15,15'-oxygenase